MIKFSQSKLEELERALNAGEDIEAPEPEWPHRTRLHRALDDGDLARAKLLLRFGANANARDASGLRPMHKITESNRMVFVDEETRADLIESLLAAGADVDAKDTLGDTPLSLAYREQHSYCVRALVDAGADPSIFGLQGAPNPTFVIDLIRNSDGAEVVANMLAMGVDVDAQDDDGHTLLDRAAFCGSPSAVRALLDADANPNAQISLPPLCSAAILMNSDGGEEAVVALIRAGANVDMLSLYDKRGPLHHAVRYRSLAAIRLLLESGADSDLSDGWGPTPLCDAVEYARDDDDHDIIKALLQGGADVNGYGGFTSRPLHVASELGHTSTIRLLLKSGANPHLCNRDGRTALHAAAQGRDCTATVSVLLEAGADPNAADTAGNTALHCALLHHRSPAAIQLLLDGGANPRIRGSRGRSTLHHALEDRNYTATVLSALLDAGADPNARNNQGETSLHYALGNLGCTTIILSTLLDAGADPNARNNQGETSLHYAVQRCSPSATQLLLKARADPDSRDKYGRTPLLYATLAAEHNTRWLEHAAALCDAGANVDCQDTPGITPLYHAISMQSAWTACFLLWLGADPRAGRVYHQVHLRLAAEMIGKTSMEAILAIVTQGGLDTSQTRIPSFIKSDQQILLQDLSESEKEGCKVLICALREEMLKRPSSEHTTFTAQLSKLYAVLNYYPSDSVLYECEIEPPQGPASCFGGFADCWQGLFLGQHKIAMKTLRGSLAKEIGARRLAREVKVWSQLNHHNVLPFLGVCTLGAVSYLISPWMENGHALDYVKEHPHVDRRRLLAQVAEGLEYLHKFKPEQVIHGDLRGPNILISKFGDACIADFGLSELKTDAYDPNYSTPFVLAGHPRWQAPEILSAETKEAARRNTTTDVFAFGRVMLELFTGKVPFSQIPYDIRISMRVMSGEFPPRPCDEGAIACGLDDSMWELMTDCWHATPSERPSAADLVARLTAAALKPWGENPEISLGKRSSHSDLESPSRPTSRLRASE